MKRYALAALMPMLLVILARLAGPEDIDQNDQAKQALYVLDIRTEGNWVLPLERGTTMATKPPLYAWLAAVASLPDPVPTEIACRLPSLLAALGVAGLIFWIGTERWGQATGLLAAWMFAATHTAVKLSVHIRPDMVLTLCTTAALFAVHRMGWNVGCGRGLRAPTCDPGRGTEPPPTSPPPDRKIERDSGMPVLFWAALALGILAKGPPALVICGVGLTVLALSRSWRNVVSRLLRSHGVLLLGLPVVWFALAYMVGGNAYIRTVVWPETVERVLGTGGRGDRGHPPGYLVAHFLAKAAPWSVFAVIGVLSSLRTVAARRLPAPLQRRGGVPPPLTGPGGAETAPLPEYETEEARRSAFLMAAWFVPGLLLFSLSRGQREDYLLPVLPAAALLAASVLARAEQGWVAQVWRVSLAAAAAGGLFLAVAVWSGGATVPAGLRGLIDGAGGLCGMVLAAAGILMLASFVGGAFSPDLPASGRGQKTPPTGACVSPRSALRGVAGFVLLQIAFGVWLSPAARSERGADLEAFAREARRQRAPGEEIVFYGTVGNGVRFLLGTNRPSVPLTEMPLLLDGRKKFGVVTTGEDAVELRKQWPGRFTERYQHRWGTGGDQRLVWLEVRGPW